MTEPLPNRRGRYSANLNTQGLLWRRSMQCRMLKLMPLLSVLSLTMCQHTATDSYCSVYGEIGRIIQKKGDGAISAPPDVRRRILAHEPYYRNQCGAKKCESR